MGVRGLQTYMQQHVPNGCIQINILKQIEKYQRSQSKSPIIVIDMMSMNQPLQTNKKDTLCGLRNQICLEIIDNFFAKLKSMGITLVFFTDGPVHEIKLDKWIERQRNLYKKSCDVLEKIYEHRSLDEIVNDPNLEIVSMTSILSGILLPCSKSHGDVNVAMTTECDLELAAYATKHNVIAIISNDSDFLIYDGEWEYWSSNINFDTYDTVVYNRASLQQHLSLSTQQLPLFATLAGNDYIRYEDLRTFHYQMGKSFVIKFSNIARYIRSLKYTSFNATKHDYIILATRIFGQRYTSNDIEKIEKSISMYNLELYCSCMKDKVVDPMLSKFSNRAYAWFHNKPTHFPVSVYSDLSKKDLMPTSQLFHSLAKRQIGIITYHSRDVDKQYRKILMKDEHTEDAKYVNIIPEYPNYRIPRYEDLVDTTKTELNGIRWNILCWIISDSLKNANIIKQIPKQYLINVLVLYFLVERKQLTILEADGFLLTIDKVNKKQIPLNIEHPKYLNERTTRITHLFCSLFVCILRCFEMSSLSEYSDYLKMDCVYFHTVIENLKSLSSTEHLEVMIEIEKYRLYAHN